jgi:hypothetical protein
MTETVSITLAADEGFDLESQYYILQALLPDIGLKEVEE